MSLRRYIPATESDCLAFDRLLWIWCEGNSQEHPHGLCAACGKPFDPEPLDLPDGARVCFRDDHGCLIAYGNGRRRQAVEALAELGVHPPESWEL